MMRDLILLWSIYAAHNRDVKREFGVSKTFDSKLDSDVAVKNGDVEREFGDSETFDFTFKSDVAAENGDDEREVTDKSDLYLIQPVGSL